MNFKKLLVAALPAMLLASCASDEPGVNPGGESTKGGLYATIKLDVPGSRSETTETPGVNTNSNAGYEEGQPYENTINNVTIVLATLENNVYKAQTYGTYTSNSAAPSPTENNVYTIQFQDTLISELATQEVYIFAYCNTTLGEKDFKAGEDLTVMETKMESAGINQGIWLKSNFMMVNAPNSDIPKYKMPEKDVLLNNYNSPEKALNLGTVDVARTAARFDYKPANEDNLYDIVDVNSPDPKNPTVVAQIEMVSMAPFNIAKDFYTLPRVSADGTSTGWDICGDEVYNRVTGVGNYVVSPNFADKKANSISALSTNYNEALFSLDNYESLSMYAPIKQWYETADEDNDQNWTATDKDGYKIWRYVTENTIPQVNNQRKGITTGVVFKGRITNPASGSLMASAMAAHKPIYFYNGTCYGDIANLRRVVANLDTEAAMRKKFEQVFAGKNYLVFEKADDGTRVYKVKDEELVDATSAENNSTFKIIRPASDNEYYVYYVYYNRHNDNGNNNAMGVMEFATVRNNVYKLSVTKVSDFGHTNDPKDDPDPEKPDQPDETPKTYFQVSCRVLPWIVRINNIPF